MEENTALVAIQSVTDIVNSVKDLEVFKPSDLTFLQEHSQHLSTILHKTHIWRTDTQKRSIVSDVYHPTLHSKFHQAILEQKVQFEQSMYLAKDFEMKKLEIEELECDLEDLSTSKRDDIKRKKIAIDIQFKHFELSQMQIAMEYRIAEVRGWQTIADDLLQTMRDGGVPEEDIWSKEAGEIKAIFLQTLTNLQGLKQTKDSAEITNLIALASFSVKQVIDNGKLEEYKLLCNAAQLESLNFILGYLKQA